MQTPTPSLTSIVVNWAVGIFGSALTYCGAKLTCLATLAGDIAEWLQVVAILLGIALSVVSLVNSLKHPRKRKKHSDD